MSGAYSRVNTFTGAARLRASLLRPEIEAIRESLLGGLDGDDLANGALGPDNLAQRYDIAVVPMIVAAPEAVPGSTTIARRRTRMGRLTVRRDCILLGVDLTWSGSLKENVSSPSSVSAENFTEISADIGIRPQGTIEDTGFYDNDDHGSLLSQPIDMLKDVSSSATSIVGNARVSPSTNPTLLRTGLHQGASLVLAMTIGLPDAEPNTRYVDLGYITATLSLAYPHAA